jgi:hypothetical protein
VRGQRRWAPARLCCPYLQKRERTHTNKRSRVRLVTASMKPRLKVGPSASSSADVFANRDHPMKSKVSFCAAAFVGLSACGGGGGGADPAAQNLQSAALAAQALSPAFPPASLTANDNGVALTLSMSPLPEPAVPAVTCGGTADPYTDTTINFTASNWSAFFPDDEQVDFYSSAPYVPCGGLTAQLGNITSTYAVTSYTPPANWTVGDAGQLATETNYSSSGTWLPPAVVSITKGAQTSTDVISYQVASYSASAVLLTMTDQNSVNGTTTEVFTVAADGAMTLQSVSLSQGAQTITLTD